MADFKTGDVVKLDVEGAPSMTVEDVHGGDVACIWFGTDGTLHRHTFPCARLSHESKRDAVTVAPLQPPQPMGYHKKGTEHPAAGQDK